MHQFVDSAFISDLKTESEMWLFMQYKVSDPNWSPIWLVQIRIRFSLGWYGPIRPKHNNHQPQIDAAYAPVNFNNILSSIFFFFWYILLSSRSSASNVFAEHNQPVTWTCLYSVICVYDEALKNTARSSLSYMLKESKRIKELMYGYFSHTPSSFSKFQIITWIIKADSSLTQLMLILAWVRLN